MTYHSLYSTFPVPSIPTAVVSSVTSKTIFLSWSVPNGSVVDSYEVLWERNLSGECAYEDSGGTTITDGSTSYNITGLEEGSSYIITVTATNMFGSVISDPVTGMTKKTGEKVTSML